MYYRFECCQEIQLQILSFEMKEHFINWKFAIDWCLANETNFDYNLQLFLTVDGAQKLIQH